MITRLVVSPAMTRLIVAGAGVRAVRAAEMTVSGKAQRGALPWLQPFVVRGGSPPDLVTWAAVAA